MKDFCAERSHLQHFIVSYLFHFARIRYNPRICGVDAVYIRVDFTDIRVQLCSEGNRSRIGAAASERCDIIVFVDPLEAGDNDNFVVIQLFTDALGVDPFEARVLIIGGRVHRYLPGI